MEVILGLVYFLFCVMVFLWASRGALGVFSPFCVLIILSVIDFIVPLFLRNAGVSPPDIPWLNRPSDNLEGVAFYVMFYVLMFIPALACKKSTPQWTIEFDEHRYYVICIWVVALWLIKFLLEIDSYGGTLEWVQKKATQRWLGGLVEQEGILLSFLSIFKWDFILNCLCFTGFYFREKMKRRSVVCFYLPVLAFFVSLTTFFRGALLNLFLGYLIIYLVEIRREKNKRVRILKRNKLCWIFCFLIVGFLGFGTSRALLETSFTAEKSSANVSILSQFAQGSGLDGVVNVVSNYGHVINYLEGKTYLDMMLLPIPRSIYTNKPEWYGIDDVARGMGWPESTQSAITMPGEAYANFGYFGLVVAVLYGVFFLWVHNSSVKQGGLLFFWYLAVGVNLMTFLNWMAFTGLVNQLFVSICVLVICSLFIRKLGRG